jgi:hypothetical protein
MQKKIAVLDTSRARKIIYNESGFGIKESHASPRLLELLDQGYTVYIASTRARLFPEDSDKCLFEVIPEDQFFHADPKMELGHAQAEGLVDLWERVLNHLNIPIPEPSDYRWARSWLSLRYIAEEAGIVIN